MTQESRVKSHEARRDKRQENIASSTSHCFLFSLHWISLSKMGVLGLTSLLREHGLFPSATFSPQAFCSALDLQTIDAGSTLAIDGLGFVFYIYRRAYREHYMQIIKEQHRYKDVRHLISALLPSMLDLKRIHSITGTLFRWIVQASNINVSIYWDGPKQPWKGMTRKKRHKDRGRMKCSLENFFTKHLLPSSFHARNQERMAIPDAQAFLQEFPMPPLLICQVQHSIEAFRNECQHGLEEGTVRITYCRGEADASVARESAMDTTNRTFCVGQDSDYCVFGSLDQACEVQYMPLDGMSIEADGVRGYVLTRRRIAEEFHIAEHLIVEVSC